MQIKNPKRTFFIGIIVWLLFFGWWFRGFLFRNWQFRLFSFSSWQHLIHEFKAGWQISSKSDWIFLFSFILAPFIFGLLWYWAQKVKWSKLWKKIWAGLRWPFLVKKKKEFKAQNAAYEPKQVITPASYRPQALPVTGNRIQNAPIQTPFSSSATPMGNFQSYPAPQFTQNADTFQTPPLYPASEPVKPEPFTNEEFAAMADTPLSEIEIPKQEAVHEDIPALLEKAGYTILPNITLGEKQSGFVAATLTKLVVALYDTESGDWLADEESFNDEDPLWFSETDHRVSPVFQLKKMAEALQQKLGNTLSVHPLLIEKEGTIINAEDMMKTWNDLGVSVCRTESGGPVELATASEVFKEAQEKITPELLEKINAML